MTRTILVLIIAAWMLMVTWKLAEVVRSEDDR